MTRPMLKDCYVFVSILLLCGGKTALSGSLEGVQSFPCLKLTTASGRRWPTQVPG